MAEIFTTLHGVRVRSSEGLQRRLSRRVAQVFRLLTGSYSVELQKRLPLKACYRCSVLVLWLPNFTNGESYEHLKQLLELQGKASGWSMVWGILMFICGILAISLPPGLLDWNCHSAGLVNSVRGNFASILCFSFSQRRRIPLASAPGGRIRDCRNLYADEPAFGRALSNAGPGRCFSSSRESWRWLFTSRIRRVQHAGWVLFDGIVTLILGIFIWAQWPPSSVWVIGTLVGISLIFSGISRFMLSLAVRNMSPA